MAVVVLLSKSYNIVLYLLFYTVFYNLERGPFFLLFLLKRPIKWLKSKHFPKVLFCVNSLTLKKSSLFCNVGFFFSQIGMCQRKIYGSSKTFHPPLYLSMSHTYYVGKQIRNCKNTITNSSTSIANPISPLLSSIVPSSQQLRYFPDSFHKKQPEQINDDVPYFQVVSIVVVEEVMKTAFHVSGTTYFTQFGRTVK